MLLIATLVLLALAGWAGLIYVRLSLPLGLLAAALPGGSASAQAPAPPANRGEWLPPCCTRSVGVRTSRAAFPVRWRSRFAACWPKRNRRTVH